MQIRKISMLRKVAKSPAQIYPKAFQESPTRLQVEVTTRCNMNCSMCVKYAPESDIAETDLSLEDFKKLGPALEHCEKLVLNGIGEPLLHPDLAAMASFARERDQDLQNYFDFVWTPGRSMKREKLFDLIREMRADAEAQDIWINLRNLAEWGQRIQTKEYKQLEEVYARSKALAVELGVELRLPPLMAENELRCSFVEEGTAFITSKGEVSPCQFLWHSCTCYLDGSEKLLRQKQFGNIASGEISEIWKGSEFAGFRSEVLEYEYPYCANCPMGPCDDITGRSNEFEYDCLGGGGPCGHCPWAMGGPQCLM